MSYIDSTLIENEKVLYRGHRHWVVFFTPLVWLIFSLVILFYYPELDKITAVPLVVTLVTGIRAVINYLMTEIAVTNMRVLVKVGWLARDIIETSIQNVSSVEIEQSFWGRMLNYSTVIICDRGNVRSPYARITHPFDFRRAVQEQLENRYSGNAEKV